LLDSQKSVPVGNSAGTFFFVNFCGDLQKKLKNCEKILEGFVFFFVKFRLKFRQNRAKYAIPPEFKNGNLL